jgi:multidrug efflux pump subunit AcrA (membrane-fusion protein)
MYVKASVPEAYIGKVDNGTEAMVEVLSLGKTQETKVRQAGNYIHPANRTFLIEVPVSNEENIMKPNLVVNVKLNDYTKEDALLIPNDVIQENAKAEKYVYILADMNGDQAILKRTKVTTGYSYNNMVEVLDGLSKGDVIVKEGAKSMREGLTVKVKS